jgi:hypothetical protein
MSELLTTTPEGSYVYRKNEALNETSDSGRSRTCYHACAINFYKQINPPDLNRIFFGK